MSRAPRGRYPDLPMDVVDAAGVLGAFAGGLSLVLPFFLGLTTTLGIVLVVAGLMRGSDATSPRGGRSLTRRRFLFGFAVVAAGWLFLMAHPPSLARIPGVVLGLSGLPLWAIARRPQPFGGE